MPEGFWPDELSVKQVEAERLRRDIDFHLNTIGRLTTENQRLDSGWSHDQKRCRALEAEIERLRAALAECVPFNRDACIEECARVVKAQHRLGDSVNVGLALDRAEAAIRALKG